MSVSQHTQPRGPLVVSTQGIMVTLPLEAPGKGSFLPVAASGVAGILGVLGL